MKTAAALTISVALYCSPAVAMPDCTADLERASAAWIEEIMGKGVLRPLDNRGSTMRIGISDMHWRAMNIEQKEQLVWAVQCAVAGSGKVLSKLDVVSLRSGERLANISLGRVFVPAE